MPKNEPIDLFNVAFEQQDQSFDVPDRLTAIQALLGKQTIFVLLLKNVRVTELQPFLLLVSELRAINPDRKYNLVLINVTREELTVMRPLRIRHLLHPLNTVLDDSIGCAMWYAATGAGMVYGEGEKAN